MVMMFARVRRLSVMSVQVISGAGPIEYFIFVHTYYEYTTGLVYQVVRALKLIQLLGKCDLASPRMTGLWKSGKAS